MEKHLSVKHFLLLVVFGTSRLLVNLSIFLDICVLIPYARVLFVPFIQCKVQVKKAIISSACMFAWQSRAIYLCFHFLIHFVIT